MDEFTAHFALDPSAMSKEIHDAEKCDGNGKGEDGGEVGVQHINFLLDYQLLVHQTLEVPENLIR